MVSDRWWLRWDGKPSWVARMSEKGITAQFLRWGTRVQLGLTALMVASLLTADHTTKLHVLIAALGGLSAGLSISVVFKRPEPVSRQASG